MAILIWRTHTTHSFSPYIFVTIFSILRTAGFACRAVWSQELAQGMIPLVYVATILQYIGFILEIFTVISLMINWIHASIRQGSRPPNIEKRSFTALRILVIIAQLLTVAGAVLLLVGAGDGRSDLVATGTNLKNASFYIFFVSTVIALAMLHGYYFANISRAKFSDYLLILVLYLLLLVKLGYHVAALNLSATAPVNTEEIYYFLLDALPELLICLIAVVINLSRVKNGMEPWSAKRGHENLEMKELV
ncbi:hypothetical protein BGW37DRAFT_484951 [Umbelopsis sp. PMI_123]|nr:hypothetical protein BGW37DRAFT_484951 [Umbelopsis sp. PMI_123]